MKDHTIRPGIGAASKQATAGSRRTSHRWASWALVPALAVGLAACTSDSQGPPAPGPRSPTPGSPTPGTTPGGEPGENAQGDPTVLARFFGGLTLTRHGSFGWRTVSVLHTAGPGAGPVLRVRYPADSASHRAAADGASAGGAQAYLTVRSGPLEEAWLSYDLRFQTGFDFVKGGKLPGLYGGTVTSGQHIPDGTDDFSTRYMWRTAGEGEVYAYLPTSQTHGTSIGRGSWTFPAGRWVQVVQHVRLNTPGQADGVLDVWFQGEQVLHRTDITYRSTRDLKIDGLFFSSFFGGGDRSWATPRNQYADFAGFRLSAAAIAPAAR
jgi:hypothetical protein